jgi:PAS domain S-box-containing protein
MVIPISISDERQGVLRVINKKDNNYALNLGSVRLAKSGFSEADKSLLQAVAIQIAVAINNKKLREVIETQKTYLERVIEYSPYPIIVVDPKGIIQLFNNACEKIWKISASEAVEKRVVDFYASEQEARRIGDLLKATGRVEDVDAQIKDRDGNLIDIRLSASNIWDDKGHRLGSIGEFKDLRDIRRRELEMLEAEKLETIGRLASYLSHDIKNKLIAARLDIGTIRKQAKKGKTEQLGEGLTFVDDTLKIATSKLANMALIKSFDLTQPNKKLAHVENIFDLDYLKRLAANSSTELAVNDFPKETLQILVDLEQMQMIIMNLYDNSAYALKQDGKRSAREIRICVTSCQTDALIEWSDNGCGIPKGDLNRVFESRFTTKEYGNGLGLYWAKILIEEHGGSIVVDSKEGEWTKFTIRLPLAPKEPGG